MTIHRMENMLENKEIAISISESEELGALGFGKDHLVSAMVDFARTVLMLRGRVAYGGDLRPGGFTELLLKIAKKQSDREGIIRSYLFWPINLDLVPARIEDLSPIVYFEQLPEVTGRIDKNVALPPVGTEALEIWAHNLTAMRRKMTEALDARIVLGGRITGASGTMPGIIEEALLALKARKPLFVLAGFGGAARIVWNALRGDPTPELDVDFQEAGKRGYRDFYKAYNEHARVSDGTPIDFEAIRHQFCKAGIAGLHNGLNQEENERLATTTFLPEMIALVLRGMRTLFFPT